MNKTKYPTEANMRFRIYVAAHVQDYRHNHNMSYARFARKSGLSAQRVARIETASYELYLRDLLKIAAATGATASLLLPAVDLQGAAQPA